MTIKKKLPKNRSQPGRPRSQKSRIAITTATTTLLAEKGYDAISIEAVAALAGVGKQTIYRWWGSKADLVIDAVSDQAAQQVQSPDTGTVEEDLRILIKTAFHALTTTTSGNAVAALLVASQTDSRISKAFREKFIAGRREVVREILERSINRRELKSNLDLDLLIDLIYGPMWYRLLVGHAQLDEKFADDLLVQILELIRAKKE